MKVSTFSVTLGTAAITRRYLRNHVLERLHDLGTLRFLVVLEDPGNDYDERQHDSEVELGKCSQNLSVDRELRRLKSNFLVREDCKHNHVTANILFAMAKRP